MRSILRLRAAVSRLSNGAPLVSKHRMSALLLGVGNLANFQASCSSFSTDKMEFMNIISSMGKRGVAPELGTPPH